MPILLFISHFQSFSLIVCCSLSLSLSRSRSRSLSISLCLVLALSHKLSNIHSPIRLHRSFVCSIASCLHHNTTPVEPHSIIHIKQNTKWTWIFDCTKLNERRFSATLLGLHWFNSCRFFWMHTTMCCYCFYVIIMISFIFILLLLSECIYLQIT